MSLIIWIQVYTHAYTCNYLIFFLYFSDYIDRQDMAKALLAAARRGYKKIMRCILQKDESVMVEELPDCNNNCVLGEAMTEGLSSLFEVCAWEIYVVLGTCHYIIQ